MSIGTVAVYGLFSLTPKFRSPLNKSRINTPMCINPTRAIQLCLIITCNQFSQIHSIVKAYTDLLVSRSNDTVLVPTPQERRNFLIRNIRISYCSHTFSKRTPITLGESVLSLSSLVGTFASMDCSII